MSGHRDVRPGRAGEFHGGTGIPYEFDSLAGQTAWNAKTDEYGYMVPGDSTSETKARRAARTQSGRPVVANSGYNEDTGVKTTRTRKVRQPKRAK